MKNLSFAKSDKKLTQSFSEQKKRSTEDFDFLCGSSWNEFSLVK